MTSLLAISFVLLSSLAPLSALGASTYTKVEQGWNAEETALAYNLNLGAQIIPARWFFALEVPDSEKKFATDLQRFGLVMDAEGNPIGITESEDAITGKLYSEKTWVGTNCTACHTGLLKINNHSVIMDGHQGLFRIQDFEESLLKAVASTLAKPEKLERFANSLKTPDKEKLKTDLSNFKKEFGAWNQRNHHFFDQKGVEVRYGPGRMDGVGGSTNDFNCHLNDRMGDNELYSSLIVNEANCRSSHPPVSLPHLWGMTFQEFTQRDGRVHSSIGRNVGAMMAGYGKNWVEMSNGVLKFKTSVKIENVVKFEGLYKKLTTPLWKDLATKGVVPALDQKSIERGKKVYADSCLRCHAVQPESTIPNVFGNSYWKTVLIPASSVGTADDHLLTDGQRRALIPEALYPQYQAMFGPNVVASDGTVPAQSTRTFFVAAMLKSYFTENKIPLQQIALMSNCRDSKVTQTEVGFKSKSLEGIVWTAPYLHNGSVPTLIDLLKPAKDRPKKFYLGCNDYDIKSLGYNCKAEDENIFLFDTTLEGNLNKGHEFGAELSASSKEDLLSYLKSLEQPAPPSPQNPDCN